MLNLGERQVHLVYRGTDWACRWNPCALQEKNIKHSGSVTMADIIEIARVMRPRSCAKDLANGCKEILGTAVSVGCKVDGKDPRDVIAAVSRLRGCIGVVEGRGSAETLTGVQGWLLLRASSCGS